jgi:hypothetical protein
MKLKMRWKVSFVVILFACGCFIFLFYFPFGLMLQAGLVVKLQSLYLRFVSARVATVSTFDCKDSVARSFYQLAMNDLRAAHDTTSMAIAQHADAMAFRRRANIEMSSLHYSNAVADFEQALESWKRSPYHFDFNAAATSNQLELAKACARAKEMHSKHGESLAAAPAAAESRSVPSGNELAR